MASARTVLIGFIAARTRRTSPVDILPSVPPARPVARRIVPVSSRAIRRRRPSRGGRGDEAVAELDPLDRLDAHERAGEARVESAVPVHVEPRPGGSP